MTLELLDYTTTWLGAQMRLFHHETCSKVATKELQREADTRAKREGKGKSKGRSARKAATFGMFTIKFHFLGDYTSYIRHYGTTDSFSTETVSRFSDLPESRTSLTAVYGVIKGRAIPSLAQVLV